VKQIGMDKDIPNFNPKKFLPNFNLRCKLNPQLKKIYKWSKDQADLRKLHEARVSLIMLVYKRRDCKEWEST